MSLRKRTSTAAVLLALVFVCIQYSADVVFFIVIQALILASLWEFYNLAAKRELAPRRILGFAVALIIALSFFLDSFPLGLALFSTILLTGIFYVLTINKLEKLVSFAPSIALTFLSRCPVSNMKSLPMRDWARVQRQSEPESKPHAKFSDSDLRERSSPAMPI